MKNVNIFYLIIISFLTLGCSSDDNSVSSPDQFIIGNWTIANMSINGNVTSNDREWDPIWIFQFYPIPVDATIENQNYTVNFSESNQITSNGSLKTSYVAYVDDYINKYEYSKVIENVGVFKNGNWSLDDTFLTVASGDSNEKYPIISLSENKIVVIKHLKDYILLNLYGGPEVINCIANLEVLITFQKN